MSIKFRLYLVYIHVNIIVEEQLIFRKRAFSSVIKINLMNTCRRTIFLDKKSISIKNNKINVFNLILISLTVNRDHEPTDHRLIHAL